MKTVPAIRGCCDTRLLTDYRPERSCRTSGNAGMMSPATVVGGSSGCWFTKAIMLSAPAGRSTGDRQRGQFCFASADRVPCLDPHQRDHASARAAATRERSDQSRHRHSVAVATRQARKPATGDFTRCWSRSRQRHPENHDELVAPGLSRRRSRPTGARAAWLRPQRSVDLRRMRWRRRCGRCPCLLMPAPDHIETIPTFARRQIKRQRCTAARAATIPAQTGIWLPAHQLRNGRVPDRTISACSR